MIKINNIGYLRLTNDDLEKINNLISNFGKEYAANLVLLGAQDDTFEFEELPTASSSKLIIDAVVNKHYEVID